MKTHNVGSTNYLMNTLSCTGNDIILWDSIGLIDNGYPCIGKKSHYLDFSKQGYDQKRKILQLIKNWNMRISTPLGGCFSFK